MTIFPAHIAQVENATMVQTVKEHCHGTAEYAKECLKHLGLGETAYLAGLLHDFGKCTLKYKRYIEDAFEGKEVKRGSVNHTFAAVAYIFDTYGTSNRSNNYVMASEVIGFAVGAHHGLFDAVGITGENGFLYRVEKDREEICYEEAKKNYFECCFEEKVIQELFVKAADEINKWIASIRSSMNPMNLEERISATEDLHFQIGLLSRLILSSVIHGDRRDTAEFFAGKKQDSILANKELWGRQLDYFQKEIIKFTADNPINQARQYISEVCGTFIAEHGGVYRITVPTGSGKTIAMLRFALTQAKRHNKKRIIFIIPLLSVLDQNSQVIQNFIESKDMIFEHHSNVVHTEDTLEELDRYELLADTWGSPIIVSTLVQLLNILFSSKTSAIRRMQSLCDSVIVIDEVQSVPKKITYMFNMAINFLASCTNATIVLSSATQPAFDYVKKKIKLGEKAEILPYSKELWNIFERTQIINRKNNIYDDEEKLAEYVVNVLAGSKSILVICNTKKNAAKLYNSIQQMTDTKVFHLSTAMCMAHRKSVLRLVNEYLDRKESMICVTTQIVEAGVDFSFEYVIRVEAGLDNIAQAAGRCNRHGISKKKGIVEIVRLRNERLSMLREIETAQNCFRRFMADYENERERYKTVLSPASVERYFKLVFQELEPTLGYPIKINMQNVTMFDLLAQNKRGEACRMNYCVNQAFKTAGDYFKVFEEESFDVIVPYDSIAERIIDDISVRKSYDFEELHKLLEEAKPYIVHIYKYQKEILETNGMIFKDKEGRIMMLNQNAYSAEIGLVEDVGNDGLFF